MNIFEALAKGDGKATFSSSLSGEYAYFNYKDLSFHWLRKNVTSKLSDLSIRSMYWIPYVPHEKTKHKEVFKNVKWITGMGKINAKENNVRGSARN